MALPSAAYVQNRLLGCFLNEWSLLLGVEMGRSAMSVSSPFSTHVCWCPVPAGEFFSSFFEASVPRRLARAEGSGVTAPWGKLLTWLAGLCHSHRNQPSCHRRLGVLFFFF